MDIQKPYEEGLTSEEESKLINSLKEFAKWLISKKIVRSLPSIYIEDFPFTESDWVMKFDRQKGAVSFNTFSRKKCSFDYYQSIVLHEFFHLAVQRVPNKEDAVKIKDDFGGELMKLIDIEADFFTALFFKEHFQFGLVQYLKLYHEGSQVFSDKWIRVTKFERYIGTLLSISKMFLDHHDNNKKVKSYDLYLVSINPFYTEENMHVLVIRKEHIYFDLIQATMQDFIKLKECYTNIDGFSFKSYVNRIVSFVSKALAVKIPEKSTRNFKSKNINFMPTENLKHGKNIKSVEGLIRSRLKSLGYFNIEIKDEQDTTFKVIADGALRSILLQVVVYLGSEHFKSLTIEQITDLKHSANTIKKGALGCFYED